MKVVQRNGLEWLSTAGRRTEAERHAGLSVTVRQNCVVVFLRGDVGEGTHCGISAPDNGRVYFKIGSKSPENCFEIVRSGRGARMFSINGHCSVFKNWSGKHQLKCDDAGNNYIEMTN